MAFTAPPEIDCFALPCNTIHDCGPSCRPSGKVVVSFQSPVVAHDHKTVVSLATHRVEVNRNDISIKGVAK